MKKDCLLLVLIVLFNLTGCERPKAPEATGLFRRKPNLNGRNWSVMLLFISV